MRWTVRAVSRSALAVAMSAVAVSSTVVPLLRVEAAPPTLCKATLLQSKSFPQLRSIPWLKAFPVSAGITAHLFYASGVKGKAAMMHTHGRNPGGRTTKVLWLIDNPADDNSITIDGKNLTGHGKTHQVFPGAGGGIQGYDDFPSIVDVPTAGCWRFQVTGGAVRAAVTIRVVG
jgi:hypothetical protein